MTRPYSPEQPPSTDTTDSSEKIATGRSAATRTKRISKHFTWYSLAQVVNLGLPHLLLFPICMHWAGEAIFGRFVYALGIVNTVGTSPTTGLCDCLLRNMSGVRSDRQPLLLRTAFVLACSVVSVLAVIAIAACLLLIVFDAEGQQTYVWISILIIVVACQNIVRMNIPDLTVARNFAAVFVWQNLGRVLCFLALPGLLLFGPSGMVVGFGAGYLLALAATLCLRRKVFLGTPQFDSTMAKRISASWSILSLSTLFLMSSHYVHRTVLGSFAEFADVSIFFAAAASLELCVLPATTLSTFAISMLSAHKSRAKFTATFIKKYAAVSLLCSICSYWIFVWIAPLPVKLLYPKVASQAVQLMPVMGIGVAGSLLIQASRPFVLRFASARALLLTSIVSFVSHLTMALILIPLWKLRGAAWAYSAGTTIVAASWFVILLVCFLRPTGTAPDNGSVDNFDSA